MTTAYSGDILALAQAISFDPQTMQQVTKSLTEQLNAQLSEFDPLMQIIPAIKSGNQHRYKLPEIDKSLESFLNDLNNELENLLRDNLGNILGGGLGNLLSEHLDNILKGNLDGLLDGALDDLIGKAGVEADYFLQFFKELAAASGEATSNLGDLGAAITAFADLAAKAAQSISSALGMKPASNEDGNDSSNTASPETTETMNINDFTFEGQYQKDLERSLAVGQPPQPQPRFPLLDNASSWVKIIVDKFEPLLQRLIDYVNDCTIMLVLIHNDIKSASKLPEGPNSWTRTGDFLSQLAIGFAVLAITLGPIALLISVCALLLARISYWFGDTSSKSNFSPESINKNNFVKTYEIYSDNTKYKSEKRNLSNVNSNSIEDGHRVEWPNVFGSPQAINMSSKMAGNNSYYSNCNNQMTATFNIPPHVSTPDAIAGQICRELKTLGMSFNYPIRG